MSLEELKALQTPTRLEYADGLWTPGRPVDAPLELNHAERLRRLREHETTGQRVNYPPQFLRRIGMRSK